MIPVKVLGIVGSPHRYGNTTFMLEQALDAAQEAGASVELVHLLDYDVRPCLGCLRCVGRCVQDDGMPALATKLLEAQGIIAASPVYFGTMSAQLKIFVDRTRVLRHNEFSLANKVFGAISVAGRRNGGQETTLIEMITAFMRHGVLVVNNGPGTSQYGGTGWAGPPGEAGDDEWGIVTCRGVGRRVTEVAQIVQTGMRALAYKPHYEFSGVQGTYQELRRQLASSEGQARPGLIRESVAGGNGE
ncbi:MAG: flavodoxin family protein [Bacillota bacterium]